MPYSPSRPPSKTRKLSPKRRRQWVHVYNSARERGADEGSAHRQAWSAAKKGAADDLSLLFKQAKCLRAKMRSKTKRAGDENRPFYFPNLDPRRAAPKPPVRTPPAPTSQPAPLKPVWMGEVRKAEGDSGDFKTPLGLAGMGEVRKAEGDSGDFKTPSFWSQMGEYANQYAPHALMGGGALGLIRALMLPSKDRDWMDWLLPALLGVGGLGMYGARNNWFGAGQETPQPAAAGSNNVKTSSVKSAFASDDPTLPTLAALAMLAGSGGLGYLGGRYIGAPVQRWVAPGVFGKTEKERRRFGHRSGVVGGVSAALSAIPASLLAAEAVSHLHY